MPGKPRFYNNQRPLRPQVQLRGIDFIPTQVIQTDGQEATWHFPAEIIDAQLNGESDPTNPDSWNQLRIWDVSESGYMVPDIIVEQTPTYVTIQYGEEIEATDFWCLFPDANGLVLMNNGTLRVDEIYGRLVVE